MKQQIKRKGLLFSAFCIAVGLITALAGTLGTFAESTVPVQYVQDIKMYQGSGSDAQAYFNSIGYTFLSPDLNSGTGTGESVYIGYKTTTDKDKALTDIRMMAMDTGYQMYDYKGIQNYLASQQQGTAQVLFSTANEFAANYEMGSPKALEAYKGLNLFDIGDKNKTKLGDYILNGEADIDFFVKMLVKASAGAVNNVLGLLNIGIAPYENNYDMDTQSTFTANWAQRIRLSSLWDDFDAGLTEDEEDDLHRQYNDLAKKLFSALQDFTTYYENAAARYNEKNITENEMFDSMENAVEQMENLEEKDTDLLFIAAYNTLNQYDFNDRMKLGDWLLSIGRKTSETVDLMQLYPVVEAMTDNQVEILSRTGFVSAIANLGENTKLTDYEEQLENAKKEIKNYNDGVSVSLWDIDGEDIENAQIAFTSDAVRKQKAELSLGVTSSLDKIDEDIQMVLKWIDIAVGAAFVLVGVAEVTFKICVACAAAETAFSAFCISALSIVSWMGIGLLVVTVLVIAFQLIWALVKWIIEKVQEIDKDRDHTVKPEYIFDAPDTANGTINVRYKSVRNSENKVGDLNCSKQYKWCLIACTSDTRVGSPIRADSDGRIFNIIYGNSAKLNGYDSIKFFGERNVANTNAFCEKDSVRGCYIHYRTDYSITNASPEPDSEGEKKEGSNSYIEDLIVSVGKTEAEAKAKILAKDKKFYILDANLSPGSSYATFVGYAITSDKNNAVRDIRVSPYAGKPEGTPTYRGSMLYSFVENVGAYVAVGDDKTRPQADALYYSKDENAGPPILADGLHVVNKFDKVKPGWEPVSLFGADYPYDFNIKLEDTPEETTPNGIYSGYTVRTVGAMAGHGCSYFYFEPETQYTSGTKYLSGFFFIGGRDYKKNDKNSHFDEKYENLVNYAKSIPHAVVIGGKDSYNMASSLNHSVDFGAGTGGYWLNLVYTYTYNPHRAVYDAAVYQGTLFSDSLPYTLSKKSSSGQQLNYIACSYIGQQSYKAGWISRYIGINNTFKDRGGVNFSISDINAVRAGHTTTSSFAQNVKYGFTVSGYIPTGLYVLGYTQGKEPIKLADVVITNKTIKGKSTANGIAYNVKGLKTLDNTDATGDFHSVQEMKNPHNATPFEFSYSSFFNNKTTETNPTEAGYGKQVTNLFIYLRNPEPAKPKYISALSVGTYSRAQYKEKNPGAKDEVLKAVDAVVDGQALNAAVAGCTDEVVYTNFAIANQSDAWYNKRSIVFEGNAAESPPENNVAAYIGVTRTDKKELAITGVLLYQYNDSDAPDELKIEKVVYKCAGTQAAIEMNGKKYFLYYTTNTGIDPGAPITEIMVDNSPMAPGYATNRAYDKNHTAPYGNPNQTNFIHLKYDKEDRDIYTKLYIGTGNNRRAALCDLLSQGCYEYVDMDLNKGVEGKSIYMGFRSKHIDWASIDESATEAKRQEAIEKALTEAVYDIVITRQEEFRPQGFVGENRVYYYPVSDKDLTGGAGDKIYMYYCCPYYSKNYNDKNGASTVLPQDAFTGYYSQIGMSNYDRVPYNTSLAGAAGSNKSVIRWEYVMFSDNSRPANPNAGTVAYSYADNCALDNRVTIFAQRSDGSVKPGAEITGGYLTETEKQGTLKYTKN